MSRIIHKSGIPKPAVVAIGILIVLLVLFGGILGLAYARANSGKILSGVSAYGFDLGDKTEEQARAIMNQYKNDLNEKEFTLVFNKNKTKFVGKDIELKASSAVIDDAIAYGKSSNFFAQAQNVLKSFFGQKYDASEGKEITIDEDALKQKISTIISSSGDTAVDDTYEISGDVIIITKGHDGVAAKIDNVSKKIIESAKDATNPETIEIEATINKSQDIDIDWLYNLIHVEKANAEYTTGGEYVKERVGVSFNRAEAYAKYKTLEPDSTMKITIVREMPDVTTENLAQILFGDTLGSFKTNYVASNTNRSTNLRIAAENIDGKIFLPGEVFSYNKEVGERTAARGFREAHVYSGGEVVDGLGGGICQISSTLYNAVLLADLEIVERKNHMFWPEYVDPGFDATVQWGSIDFQFKNNRKSPIKIVASVKNGVASISIMGKKEENEPKISLRYNKLAEYEPTTIQRNDASIPAGTTKQIQSPVKGYKVEPIIVYKDAKTGAVIKEVKLPIDSYSPTNRIVAVGTKVVETPIPITPEPVVITQAPPVITPKPVVTSAPTRIKLTPVPAKTSQSYWPVGWDTPDNPGY